MLFCFQVITSRAEDERTVSRSSRPQTAPAYYQAPPIHTHKKKRKYTFINRKPAANPRHRDNRIKRKYTYINRKPADNPRRSGSRKKDYPLSYKPKYQQTGSNSQV